MLVESNLTPKKSTAFPRYCCSTYDANLLTIHISPRVVFVPVILCVFVQMSRTNKSIIWISLILVYWFESFSMYIFLWHTLVLSLAILSLRTTLTLTHFGTHREQRENQVGNGFMGNTDGIFIMEKQRMLFFFLNWIC